MKRLFARILRLFFGLFLYALGVVLTINANIGYSPWDVFHAGLASVLGFSFGVSSILTGLALVIVALVLRERIGFGTISNMLFIGLFMDIIMSSKIIPIADNMAYGIIMLIIGMFVISFGTCFYMGSGFGSGPRDSLMVALARRTKLPAGVCRAIVEGCALAVGWALGGMVGVGTVISVIAIGFCIQLTFKLTRFDPTAVRHETFRQTFEGFKIAGARKEE